MPLITHVCNMYVCILRIKNKRNRSLLARLRAGCLDLEIGIGRWQGIDRENRVCKLIAAME